MDHIFLGKFLEIFGELFSGFDEIFLGNRAVMWGHFWDFSGTFCGISRLQISGIFLEFFYGFSGPVVNFLEIFWEIFFQGFSWDFPWKQSGFWKGKVRFPAKEWPENSFNQHTILGTFVLYSCANVEPVRWYSDSMPLREQINIRFLSCLALVGLLSPNAFMTYHEGSFCTCGLLIFVSPIHRKWF